MDAPLAIEPDRLIRAKRRFAIIEQGRKFDRSSGSFSLLRLDRLPITPRTVIYFDRMLIDTR
jgi:hypothetical protein